MQTIKIAVAQIGSVKGDIELNILTHINTIEKASELGISYLVFPELSLTGYEPELASKLAFSRNDPRLQPLIQSAIDNNVCIGVGAPLLSGHIGLIVISQEGVIDVYNKMHLHDGEEKYFIAGNQYHTLDISGVKIANAICADTTHRSHAKSCSDLKASIYIAGVLITEGGYAADARAMKEYSKDFNMLVAMANHNQPTGNWLPIGKSAIWFDNKLLASADEFQNALIIAEKTNDGWCGKVINIF